MKEMDADIAKKNQTISELKHALRKATDSEEKTEKYIQDLKAQVSKTFLFAKCMLLVFC